MYKQKSRNKEEPIIIPPKIELDKRLDPAFAPELTEAINELIFRTRNAQISHYNTERDMREEILEEREKNDILEKMVKTLSKQQKTKPSLKIKDKKKVR